jgi:hypothetical protein
VAYTLLGMFTLGSLNNKLWSNHSSVSLVNWPMNEGKSVSSLSPKSNLSRFFNFSQLGGRLRRAFSLNSKLTKDVKLEKEHTT